MAQQLEPQVRPDSNNRAQRRLQQIYFLEFVVIAIPAVLFDIFTLPMLMGVAPSANPIFSLQLLLLWIGGCMGTYALWSMYFRIYKNQSVRTLKELPLIPLGCGIIANAIPVFYFIFTVTKPNQAAFVAFCLAFLAPTYVAIHWAFALLKVGLTRHSTRTPQKRGAG
jgi:hypothetical protein